MNVRLSPRTAALGAAAAAAVLPLALAAQQPPSVVLPERDRLLTGTAPVAWTMAVSRGGLAAFVGPDEMDAPRVVVRRLPQGWY